MNRFVLLLILTINVSLSGEELVPIDWDELGKTKPWETTEVHKEVPVVTPGENGAPPSDAIVLFDGADLSQWSTTPFGEGVRVDRSQVYLKQYLKADSFEDSTWAIEDNAMFVGEERGAIATRQVFGDMQLHVEWFVPVLEEETGQGYGNSGIFLMGLYELQVLNSYENPTYSNGQAGAVYKQRVPLANASKAPGNWQTYDVFFTAPRFSDSGNLISPALVTVVHNGVLIQYNTVIEGPTSFLGKPYYVQHPDKLPLVLQDHGNPVRYRNIWVREL